MRPRLLSRRPAVVVNAVLGVGLLAGAVAVYQAFSGGETTAAAATSTRIVPVQQGTVTRTVTADGTVQSASTASASFATSGTVTAINVKVGDAITKGQVLAKVDPAAANRELDRAQADLAAARDAVDRAEAAGSDTSSAKSQVQQAELAVDEAEAAVAGTVLKAPMAGTVTAVNGTLGGSASGSGSSGSSGAQGGAQGGGSSASSSSSGSGFIEIADLGRMQVSASVAEADATQLKEKQAATVTWNALSGVSQSATVTAIDPSGSSANNVVTYGVTLALDEVPAGARVGQTVSVSVTTGSVANAIYVNSAAITTAGNRHTVTVVTDGQQEIRPVEIGLEGDAATVVTSGLEVGEQVQVRTFSTSTGNQGGMPGGGFGGFPGGGMPGGGGPGGGRGTTR